MTTYFDADCTAREYVERGFIATSVSQCRIALRAWDYGVSALIAQQHAVDYRDVQRVRERAAFAATLAFLAFTDLREPEAKHIPAAERTNEDNADVRVVRPVDGRLLGSQEANLVPLSITDDRDFDYIDTRLKGEADLVIEPPTRLGRLA
jgi:hypothetical protein